MGSVGDPADLSLGQFIMDAAVRAENEAFLAALRDQICGLGLDLFSGSGIQERAGTVVESAPYRAAEMLLGFLDIRNIKGAGPLNDRSLVVFPDRESVGDLFPGTEAIEKCLDLL